MILLIYANYKYNCPDGSSALNNQNLAIPQEGYKYYFDRDSINTIQGLKLNLTIGSSPAQSSLLQFNIPNSDWKEIEDTLNKYDVPEVKKNDTCMVPLVGCYQYGNVVRIIRWTKQTQKKQNLMN